MTKERLEEVLEILSRYSDNGNTTDYYQLFGFNKNMTVEEIKNQIRQKRLQVLFHPDQIGFIPEEYHGKYLRMVEVVKDVIDAFDNIDNKEKYDSKLYGSNIDEYEYEDEDKTEDLDEVNLGKAIILNAEKYGFELTKNALVMLVRDKSANGFTRDNNVRGIVSNISISKIMNIIMASSVNDNVVDFDEIVMNYLTSFVFENSDLIDKECFIENACINTIYKYDMNGHYGQTSNALTKYSTSGDGSAFTNTNNARIDLVNNVRYSDVKFFIQCALNSERYENPYFSYQNTKNMETANISKLYCDAIIGKIKENDAQYDSDSFTR